MAAGLHRDPDLLRKPTSALDKEMRRRLWAAISEWELQVSFDRGMISAPLPLQSDCPPPTSVHDEDLTSESGTMPSARSPNEFTSTSYLVIASDTFMLRYNLNTKLNNIRQMISFDDAKKYTEDIEACIMSIPDWIGSSSEAPRAYLAITLRQFILVIQDRQYRQAKSQAERDFAKITLLSAASKIIEAHKSIVNQGCYALEFLCHDQLRAALSLCHIASTADPNADSLLTELVERSAASIISDVCEHLTDKITRYGREQRQLWIVLAADGLMKTKKDPTNRLAYMQEAVDRVTRPYYKIMACQEDMPLQSGPVSEVAQRMQRRSELPNGMIEYMPFDKDGDRGGNAVAGAGQEQSDPTLLDFEGLAAWTFEDWSFDPEDLGGGMSESV